MRHVKKLFVLLALAGASVVAFGQTSSLSLDQRASLLLTDTGIRSKISLAANQNAAVVKIFNGYAARQGKILAKGVPAEKELSALDLETSKKLLTTLNPTQRVQLRKIGLASEGIRGLLLPDVAKELKLKSAQKEKIESMIEDAEAPEADLEAVIVRRTADVSDAKERAAIEKSYSAERRNLKKQHDEADAKILNVLTPAQRKQYAAMKGS